MHHRRPRHAPIEALRDELRVVRLHAHLAAVALGVYPRAVVRMRLHREPQRRAQTCRPHLELAERVALPGHAAPRVEDNVVGASTRLERGGRAVGARAMPLGAGTTRIEQHDPQPLEQLDLRIRLRALLHRAKRALERWHEEQVCV